MKTIEEARTYIESELAKQPKGGVEEGVFNKALQLANGNKKTGFLLLALYNNRKKLEEAWLLDPKLREDGVRLYTQIMKEITKG